MESESKMPMHSKIDLPTFGIIIEDKPLSGNLSVLAITTSSKLRNQNTGQIQISIDLMNSNAISYLRFTDLTIG
jgi:hypothetical protein